MILIKNCSGVILCDLVNFMVGFLVYFNWENIDFQVVRPAFVPICTYFEGESTMFISGSVNQFPIQCHFGLRW